jgi:hypothetical protein
VKPQSSFLFVDYQAEKSQDKKVRNEKQKFLLKNYHRRKKQASILRLKTPNTAPTNHLLLDHSTSEQLSSDNADSSEEHIGWVDESQGSRRAPGQAELRSEMWSLKAYLSQGYADPFGASAVKMTGSMNMYFHHCMHIMKNPGIKNWQKLTQNSQTPHHSSMLPSRRHEDEYVVVAEGNHTASSPPGAPVLNSGSPGNIRVEQRCIICGHQEVNARFASSPR